MQPLIEHASKNGLCSKTEYEAILKDIEDRKTTIMGFSPSPLNMLVFGLGADALLWVAANPDGKTFFVENSKKWIDRCRPIPNVKKVSYRSRRWSQKKIHPEEKLHMNLGKAIEGIDRWDIIFVDGPVGRTQGRMRSIYNAWRLADSNTIVFVHDYDRECEKLYVDHFFKDRDITTIRRLARIQ